MWFENAMKKEMFLGKDYWVKAHVIFSERNLEQLPLFLNGATGMIPKHIRFNTRLMN